MYIQDTSIPTLVLGCHIGGLAIIRSLGSLGVSVYGVDESLDVPGFLSRYCRGKFVCQYDGAQSNVYRDFIIKVAKSINKKMLLIPTSDDLAVFVAKNNDSLKEYFIFPKNDAALLGRIISKKNMYYLAHDCEVDTPNAIFPENVEDVRGCISDISFPVMLKGIYGNHLEKKTGKKMIIVNDGEKLLKYYRILEDKNHPNLMIQELIPGDDGQVYIFNGYFNNKSECLAAFTGFKVRQFPIHVGAASLGECVWNQKLADITINFMKKINYQGILDIGYRLDPRDGRFKVLDINPRVGQAFRLFLAENGMDVVRAMYLNLTHQDMLPIVPRQNRRWAIEDADIVSTVHYRQEGSLSFIEWLKSYKGLEEGAWFCMSDLRPFFSMLRMFIKKIMLWLLKKIGIRYYSRSVKN